MSEKGPQPDISRGLSAYGYARLCTAHSERQNAIQQARVIESIMPSRRRDLAMPAGRSFEPDRPAGHCVDLAVIRMFPPVSV